jgi:alpha-tubulin suppressor-like RCC1 family protein
MIRGGSAYCWGDNALGELGNGSTISSGVPVPVTTSGVLSGVTLTQITVGSQFTCALSSGGLVYCWGKGTAGQLGNTASLSSSVPVAVTTTGVLAGKTVSQIDSGAQTACALAAGAAYCWGFGTDGELGNTASLTSNTPVAVTTTGVLSGITLTQVAVGTASACAVGSTGAAYCWGLGTSGQLGNSASLSSNTPVAVTTTGVLSGKTLSQITAGTSHECALGSTGVAYCWGLGTSGQLGNSASATSNAPVAVTTTGALSGLTLTQITAGGLGECALAGTGAAYCWGADTSGQLGNGSPATNSNVAVAVSSTGFLSGQTLTQIDGGASHVCALDAGSAVYCWGLNTSGQVGNTDTAVLFYVPAAVMPPQAATLAAGAAHACVLRSGKAYCWGDSANGALGNSTTISSGTPAAVYTGGALLGKTLTQITGGAGFTCALDSSGAAYCWGLGTSGQLGNGTAASSTVPVAVTTSGALSGVALIQISAGNGFACGLSIAGAAYCWGLGTSGQLGNGAAVSSNVPVAVTTAGALSGVALAQVAAGNTVTCAVSSAGAAYCWGANTSGSLGNSNPGVQSNVPVAVTTSGALSGVSLSVLSAGLSTVCAVSRTGAAYCWGANDAGQLGNSSTTDSPVPVAVTASGALSGVTLTQLRTHSGATCALSAAGSAYCWGGNTSGQLGNNSTAQSTVPVAVLAGAVNLIQLTAGASFGCALSTAGDARCWGLNGSGQAGNPDTALDFPVPTPVTPEVTMIAAAANTSCLTRNGKVYCWGDNGTGQLGNGSNTESHLPGAVSTSGVLSGETVTQIGLGQGFGCALSSAGAAYCWGLGTSGQLGNGTTVSSNVPVAVTTSGVLSGVTLTQLAVGGSSACALSSTGTAYCWGLGTSGQLGNSSLVTSSLPVAVTTTGVLAGKTLIQISAGVSHACAMDSTGLAYCWGLGTSGQLGNSSLVTSSVPVAVTTTGVLSGKILDQVSGGTTSSCGLSTAGLAYCWGAGTSGQLGNSTTTTSSAPVAVTTTGVLSGLALAQIAAPEGGNSACALSTVGLAYCWGLNSKGQLGNNSTTQATSPVAVTVGGTSAILAGVALAQVAAGTSHACAMDTAGAAYCWGDNTNGDLGNNSITQSNVAVAVGGVIPGPPTAVIATPGNGSALISWTAPASFGTGTLTGYMATAVGATGTFTCSTGGTTSCTITGLTNLVTYTVTVVTQTTDGNSPPSTAVTVTPAGPLTLTSPASLTWTVNGNGTNQNVVDSVPADQQLTIADITGTGAGWHVTVSAATFTNGTHLLPDTGTLYFTGSITSVAATTAPTATCIGACTLPTNTTVYPVAITTAASSPPATTVYSASANTGKLSMNLGGNSALRPIGWWVKVPASAFSGSYTSAVTISVVSAP